MELYNGVFVLFLLFALGIFLAKFYNVMHKGEKYDIRWVWILFICYLLTFLVLKVTLMLDPEELFFLQMYRLSTLFLVLVIGFTIAEILFYIGRKSQVAAQAYNALESRKNGS